MIKRKIRTLVAAFGVLACAGPIHSAGIPVIDAASITQTIMMVKGQAKQLTQLIGQVKTAKSQLVEAKQTLKSLTGGRGMSTLIDMTGARQMLPPEFSKALDAFQSLSAAGASKDAKRIYERIKQFGCDQRFPVASELRALCEAESYAAPSNLAMVTTSVKQSEKRAEHLARLLQQVDTQDQKAAVDLQNRIQVESAMIQNEIMMMTQALAVQEQQRILLVQQNKELGMKALSSRTGFDPFK